MVDGHETVTAGLPKALYSHETVTTEWRPPTETEVTAMVDDAYTQGLNETYTDEYGTDWDRLLALYERKPIDLGDDADGPAIRRIKASYRKGLRTE